MPRGPTKPKNKNHSTGENSAPKRVKKEPHNEVPNTYTFDANQHPADSESAASLEQLLDTTNYSTTNLPVADTEETNYDSNVWYNDRPMETAESLYNSMINHTSPAAPEFLYAQEQHSTDTLAPSIESAMPPEQANSERNLALEAMATAADALLDPALLEEPTRETNNVSSPNFEVVQEKVVPWGDVSSDDDREPMPHGWASLSAEDRLPDAQTHTQAGFHDAQQPDFVNHGTSHGAFNESSMEVNQTRSSSFQATEELDNNLRMQQIGMLLQQETSKQDVQMSSFDSPLEEACGDVPEQHLHRSNIDPSLEESYGGMVEHNAQMSSIDPALEGTYDQSSDQIQHSNIDPSLERAFEQSTDQIQHANIDPSLEESYGYATQQNAPMSNIDPSLEEAYGEMSSYRNAHAETRPLAMDQPAPNANSFEVQPRAELATRIPTSPVLANGIISPITPRAISPELAIPAFATAETQRTTNGETSNVSSKNVGKMSSKSSKTEILVEDGTTTPRADEDTVKLIEQMRKEDLGLRRRRVS